MKLIIANKNYSTWSLRGWLVLRGFDIEFDEIELELFTDNFYAEIAKHSGAAKVPVLVDGSIEVWDSLAICEYVNDQYLAGKGWPADVAQRAKARAFSAEMHSGFMALRNEMPMNIRGRRKITPSEACQKDVARIDEIWAGQWQEFGNNGGWLFGEYSIADVMFAPVVLRFITYGVALSDDAQAYANHVLNHAALQQWIAESKSDTSVVAEDEAGTEIG